MKFSILSCECTTHALSLGASAIAIWAASPALVAKSADGTAAADATDSAASKPRTNAAAIGGGVLSSLDPKPIRDVAVVPLGSGKSTTASTDCSSTHSISKRFTAYYFAIDVLNPSHHFYEGTQILNIYRRLYRNTEFPGGLIVFR